MLYSRREMGKLALAGLPAAAVLGTTESIFGAFAQAKPNSLIDGVQIGTITYSFRSMPDQSAEAMLKYIVDSGISAIELMGGPIESFAGAPTAGGRGGGGGGRGPSRRAGRRPGRPRRTRRDARRIAAWRDARSVERHRVRDSRTRRRRAAVVVAADAGAARRRPSSRRRSRSRRPS